MTPADVIADARRLVSDVGASQVFPDATYQAWVGHAVARTAVMRPDLFAVTSPRTSPIDLLSGTDVQEIPSNGFQLLEVVSYRPSSADTWGPIRETKYASIRGTAALAGRYTDDDRRIWARHPKARKSYFVYPPPPSGAQVQLQYAQSPAPLVLDAEIPTLDAVYHPLLVYHVAATQQGTDTEPGNFQLSEMYMNWWREALAVDLQSRTITDQPDAGVQPPPTGTNQAVGLS